MLINQKIMILAVALLNIHITASSAFANDVTKSVEDALKFGNGAAVKFNLNYRYENANQEEVPNPLLNGRPLPAARQPQTANANTVRLRLGLLSPVFHGLQGYAEYQGLYAMQSDYNSTRNGKTGYTVIADPYENELDQLWISYAGIPDTLIKGGRQVIKFDDDRFIGNVLWRQLQQTYDSVLITHNNQQLFGLTVNAGYIGNVKTFTATNEHINAPILNVNYKVGDYGNLVGYGYWLGFTDPDVYFKSNQSYGIRLTNYLKPEDSLKMSDNYGLVYTAEWSIQKDYINSSNSQFKTLCFNW